MSQQVKCPVCDALYSSGEKFCFRDGARLPHHSTKPVTQVMQAGRVVAGRFLLCEILGAGGMGMVYRATHTGLDRSFAVKLLRREFISNQRAVERFFHEARAASRMDHANIVSIYDCGIDQGEPYLAMEYVAGVSLHEARAQHPTAMLPVRDAVEVLLQVAAALSHAHERGVVHRDIKPENVLLTSHAGQPDWVKMLDFGVARIVGQPRLTMAGDGPVGTPEFMAPELLVQDDQAGPPADLYALGMMLHDIVCGAPPFTGKLVDVIQAQLDETPKLLSQRQKGQRIPPDLDLLCARLLDKDSRRRPTAGETVAQLEEVRSMLPPRSLRSLLLAETLILAAQPAGRGSSLLETLPVPAHLQLTVLSPAPGKTTVLLPALQDLGNAEEESRRVRENLFRQVDALGRHLWPDDMPQEVVDLHKEVARHAAEQCRLEAQLQELLARREQERKRAHDESEQARQRIVELRVEQQLGGAGDMSMQDELLLQEQRYAQAQQSLEAEAPEVGRVCQALSESYGRGDRALVGLCRLVLETTAPMSLSGDCRRLQKQLSHFETLLATLSLQGVVPA